MTPAVLAPEIDRLVWAVNWRAVPRANPTVFTEAGLPPAAAGSLNNLIPFLDELTEPFIRRRYVYRPPEVMSEFLAALVDSGCFVKVGDRLRPTDRVVPVREELDRVMRETAHHFWDGHEGTVEVAMGPARRVLEASPQREGLAQAAIASPEPDDDFHRFHQRLAGLRLLRNEAHVEAWRTHDLEPPDVEVLTAAWSGSPTQSPVETTQRLEERGYVRDGVVTRAGLDLRQAIEDATNEGVAHAFSVIDQAAFGRVLQALPPEHP